MVEQAAIFVKFGIIIACRQRSICRIKGDKTVSVFAAILAVALVCTFANG